MHSSIANSDCIRLKLKFTMLLSLTVNPVNCVCPLRGCQVTDACLVGIDPTFIAGVLLTHISCSGCIHSSQTPTFSPGTKAALLLGSPGREKHKGEKDCLSVWTATMSGLAVLPRSAAVLTELCFQRNWNQNRINLPVKALRIQCFQKHWMVISLALYLLHILIPNLTC